MVTFLTTVDRRNTSAECLKAADAMFFLKFSAKILLPEVQCDLANTKTFRSFRHCQKP
jgi:hypothetical protein